MKIFDKYKKSINVKGIKWTYYRLGNKRRNLLFLPGGLKKAKIGYQSLEQLAEKYSVIAPDFPPVKTIDELIDGIEKILIQEDIKKTVVVGQSYGGVIAQAVYWFKPEYLESLILSSSGPASFTATQMFFLNLNLLLLKLMPEKIAKKLFLKNINRVMSFKESEKEEYQNFVNEIAEKELTKEDVYSFFSTISSYVSKFRKTNPPRNKKIPISILASEDDPTQNPKYKRKFEILYGPVKFYSMGNLGHTIYLSKPDYFADKINEIING